MLKYLNFRDTPETSAGISGRFIFLSKLATRWSTAAFFLASGVNSLLHWPKTLVFFCVDHQITWVAPVAAVLSTAAELALPIFLILGLLPSLTKSGLVLINTVALFWFGPLSGAQSVAGLQIRFLIEVALLVQLWRAPIGVRLRMFFASLRTRS